MRLVQIDGLWWPKSDEVCRDAVLSEVVTAVPWFLSHCKGRDLIVQAGGNVGVYPLELAKHFHKIYTVEPDPENFEALMRNFWPPTPRRWAINAALGAFKSTCDMVKPEAHNCGAHRIDDGDELDVIAIDHLALEACDAIWLDVEGSELPALKGARKTIERFHPVIATEEKGIGRHYGYDDADIGEFLAKFGYSFVSSHGNDRLYKV